MERQQVEAGEALQSIIDICPILAVQPYVELVGAGALSTDEAAARLNRMADMLEAMDIPAPFVGYAMAKAIREYAAVFERSPRGQAPTLEVITGGKSDAADEPPQ